MEEYLTQVTYGLSFLQIVFVDVSLPRWMTDYAAYAEAIHAICEGQSFFELNGGPDLLKEVFVGSRFYLFQALLCGVSTCFLMIKYGLFSLKH